jgi:hypothetical protein
MGTASPARGGGDVPDPKPTCRISQLLANDVTSLWLLSDDSRITRVAKSSGTGFPLTPVGSGVGVASIAADSLRVSFGAGQTREISYIEKTDPTNAVRLFAANQNVANAIVTDETLVDWTTDPGGAMVKLARAAPGTAPTVLASGLSAPTALAQDATSLFVAVGGDGTGVRVPKAGGPTEVLASGLALPCGVAADTRAAYWTECEGGKVGGGRRR